MAAAAATAAAAAADEYAVFSYHVARPAAGRARGLTTSVNDFLSSQATASDDVRGRARVALGA